MLPDSTIISGIGVGLNAATGTVHQVASKNFNSLWAKSTETPEVESTKLSKAIAEVSRELATLAATSGASNREILDALRMILEDEELVAEAQLNIHHGWSASAAFGMAINTFSELIGGDGSFEERVADLQDLSKRVQAKLLGVSLTLDLPTEGKIILVGEDFAPADTAQFTDAVVGVVTFKGGPTSHTSIICRSQGIAAVVAAPQAQQLEEGQQVLVDPVGNRVVVGAGESLATQAITFVEINQQPLIDVRANVGSLKDAQLASSAGATGVGLLRTEFLFLNSLTEPSVESQTSAYAEIFDASPADPIVVRTIDAVGDKPIAFITDVARQKPSVERGYYLLHEHRDIIERQLAAIEAARKLTGRDVWVMAPLIASVNEAKDFCDLAKSIGDFKVGIMVEVPSITENMGRLAGIADFVSIGTNDLSQYLFEVDRLQTTDHELLSHWQPRLIETIAKVTQAASDAGIEVSVCGESASDPEFAIVLAGLGVSSVSASPSQIEIVRSALRSVSLDEAKSAARKALGR